MCKWSNKIALPISQVQSRNTDKCWALPSVLSTECPGFPRAVCQYESRSQFAGALVQWFHVQELTFVFKRNGQDEWASVFISVKPRRLSKNRGL